MNQINWSVVNTGILVAALGFLWHQSRRVDALYQGMMGLDGRGGLMDEMTKLRLRVHELASTLMTLNGAVQILTKSMDDRERRP